MQTGAFSKGWGLFSEAFVWGLTFAGALETCANGHVAVLLGLGAVPGLNLLVVHCLSFFSLQCCPS